MREVAAEKRKELLFQKAREFLNYRYIFFQFGKLPLPPSMLGREVFESVDTIQRRLPPSTTLEMRPPQSQTPAPQRFDNYPPLWPSHFSSSSAQPQFKEPEPQPQPQPSTSFIRPWLNLQEENFRIVQTAPIRPLPSLKLIRKKTPSPSLEMNNFGETETEISTNHQLEGETFLIEFENARFEIQGERQTETVEGEGERQTETVEGEGERERQEFERAREEEERAREEEERERQEFERTREEGERERQEFERAREEEKERQKETEKLRERIGAQKRKASHYTECKCYQCKFEKKMRF
jgi:hypothetical protein